MDIQEIIKFSKNKIEADDLTKQVRRRIKETIWEKQNQREGFSETFKPLITKFEEPEDSKENIFTQNQKMLQNQLALTSALKENQKAITDGFSQFERLADMRELAPLPPKEELSGTEQSGTEQTDVVIPKKYITFDLEKKFDKNDLVYLYHLNFPRPNNFVDVNPKRLQEIYEEVNNEKTEIGRSIGILRKKQNKKKLTDTEYADLNGYKHHHKILSKYLNILNIYLTSIDLKKVGEGRVQRGRGIYFSPQELIKRFELLNGSLAAGNNGVLHEYIQIAHRLRDLGIFTNNQLNKLLRNYLNI